MRWLVVVVGLAACSSPKRDDQKEAPAPAPVAEQKPQTIEHLQMAVPEGWTAAYDAEWDKWLFDTPPIADGRTANARIERADPHAVASPDAYLAQRLKYWDQGTTAEIEKREGVKDGFAMTVVVKPAVDPAHPKRETYVVRQLGNVWYQCMSEWIPDDAIRDQLVALCKSLKL